MEIVSDGVQVLGMMDGGGVMLEMVLWWWCCGGGNDGDGECLLMVW